jgi:hypothetical protein
MRTRITLLTIFVVAIAAIALIWRFPRSSGAATESASVAVSPGPSSAGSVGDVRRADRGKPPLKSPASGGKPSPGCVDCVKRECWNLIDGCSTLNGDATEGPAAGKPRKQLCEQMLECARSTGCDSPTSYGCYCGSADLSACLAGQGKGVCRATVEAAAESTDAGAVFKRLKDKAYASGVVEPLLTCETRGCPDDCVPYYR